MSTTKGTAQGWALPLSVLIIGTFMSVLDTTIVNVAIPKMQTGLGAPPDDIEWVATGYTLALGVVVPLTGWLGDRIGKTNLYIWAMVGFAATSVLCGLAWDLPSMIAFRILQAIPGGLLPVVSMTLLYQIVPPARIGSAMGMYGLGVVVAPSVGPVLGGYLVQYVDWRLIFYINAPVGLLGTAAALAVLPRSRPTQWPRFDLWGFVTIAYGLFALLLVTSEGQSWGWDGYRIRMLLISGVLSLATFVVIELEVDNPLIDLRVFRRWPYLNSILLMSIMMVGSFTAMYFIPQFLQNVQGLQALDAGLTMVPSALVLLVMMPVAGRLYDRFGPRWPVVIGVSVAAYASFLLAGLTPGTPRFDVIMWTCIRNFGTGLAMMSVITSGLASLAPALTASASGMNNIMQRVSSSVAVAVFSSLGVAASAQLMSDRSALLDTGAQALPEVAAATERGPEGLMGLYQMLHRGVQTETYNNGFYIAALMSTAGILLALTLRSGPARRTTAQPTGPAGAPETRAEPAAVEA
ncbi:EmrB/QacA subfamily drug resistance transporter [Pseudonocardia eucalypti]|uniref:DHA2 family efflux MFS transporter permease subunit n=1 Tax=Pseudonocardia eucalypti TaxID=648755 RepID=UPI00160A14D7|nr:EmrB/QacA subfamily drug resistance transporter [Pseudonocardia eucalypti]